MITAPSDQQHQTGRGQVALPLLLHLRGHHGLQGQIWGDFNKLTWNISIRRDEILKSIHLV